MKLSCVIPTHNRCAILTLVLDGLKRQSYPGPFEVVIVDDGSIDATENAVKRCISGQQRKDILWRYLYQPERGPAAARNKGVESAQGEYILFLGDDIVPEEHLIREHLRLLESAPFLGSIGVLAWHPASGNPRMAAFRISWIETDYSRIPDQGNCDFTYFCTANAGISRELLLKERFDENFFYPALEDVELGYRLKERGVKFVLNKEARAYHLHHYEEEDLVKRQERIGASLALLVEKHPRVKARFVRGRDGYLFFLSALLAHAPFIKGWNKDLYWSCLALYSRYKGYRNSKERS